MRIHWAGVFLPKHRVGNRRSESIPRVTRRSETPRSRAVAPYVAISRPSSPARRQMTRRQLDVKVVSSTVSRSRVQALTAVLCLFRFGNLRTRVLRRPRSCEPPLSATDFQRTVGVDENRYEPGTRRAIHQDRSCAQFERFRSRRRRYGSMLTA